MYDHDTLESLNLLGIILRYLHLASLQVYLLLYLALMSCLELSCHTLTNYNHWGGIR